MVISINPPIEPHKPIKLIEELKPVRVIEPIRALKQIILNIFHQYYKNQKWNHNINIKTNASKITNST